MLTPERETELYRLARETVAVMRREDALFVSHQIMRDTPRFVMLLCAHGGEVHDADSMARLMLRLAKRINTEKGGLS